MKFFIGDRLQLPLFIVTIINFNDKLVIDNNLYKAFVPTTIAYKLYEVLDV